jgi:hypothetical protein
MRGAAKLGETSVQKCNLGSLPEGDSFTGSAGFTIVTVGLVKRDLVSQFPDTTDVISVSVAKNKNIY